MKKIVSLFLIAAVLFLSSCSTKNVEQMPQKQSQNKADNAVATKNAAQDFKLKTIDGNEVSLADYKGKAIVLNFLQHGVHLVEQNFLVLFKWLKNTKMMMGLYFYLLM